MTSSSSPLPATSRALARRVAVGQAEGRTPSLVGAVARDGRPAWCGARSMLEGHEPDGDTQYRIGSLTKTFIAVLVMRLRDEGLLDLADPLGKYLEDPGGPAASATIAQLLSHTSGLPSETPGPWWERSPGERCAPGSATSSGRRRIRRPPVPLLQSRLRPARRAGRPAAPARLGRSAAAGDPRAAGHGPHQRVAQLLHARGFGVHPWADVMQLEPADPTGLLAPAGELWSTAEDLCRFGAFLLGGDDRVLAATTLAEMRAPAAPPGDETWSEVTGSASSFSARAGGSCTAIPARCPVSSPRSA